jgi:hypothetical protein
MRHYHTPAKTGDVIVTKGTGNAPGAGGTISTVIITDKNANGKVPEKSGYACRDATPAEIEQARESGNIRTEYCS